MNALKVKYCIEDLKYRVFGLFPFFAEDGNGGMQLYPGNSMPDGCYGQLACALKIPCNLIVNEELILKQDNIYQYKTLKYYYNKYKHLKKLDFIKFMDEGIGVKRVPRTIDFEECDLVAAYVNLSECKELYDEMARMKSLCEKYIKKKSDGGLLDCDMECMVDKYNRMGGDVMLEFYKKESLDAENIAQKFLGYADKNKSNYKINLFIGETIHDMGLVAGYTDLWEPHIRYYKGDLVVYEQITYICKGKFEDGKDVGVIADWDDNENAYVFELTYYETIKDALARNDKDLESYDGLYGNNVDVNLIGKSDSKLKMFKKYGDYLNKSGQTETPGIDEDWLFYYKLNQVKNYTATRDEYGNIALFDGCKRADLYDVDTNLMLYGDILTDIQYDTDNNEIEFTYVIGAHLTATLIGLDVDEFNQKLYKYNNFRYDSSDKYHGVIYKEKYPYEKDGELDLLIKDSKFREYITEDKLAGYEYTKAQFKLTQSIETDSIELNGTSVGYCYHPSQFTATLNSERDTCIYPLIRPDYYDGVSYIPEISANVAFDRGNAAAFEKHIKLGEVKSFDDLLNYMNGEYFKIQ